MIGGTMATPGNGYFAFPSITRTHNGFVRPHRMSRRNIIILECFTRILHCMCRTMAIGVVQSHLRGTMWEVLRGNSQVNYWRPQ